MINANKAMLVVLEQFASARTGKGHSGVGRLLRTAGPPNGLPAVTGMDIVQFKGSRIRTLYLRLGFGTVVEARLRSGAATEAFAAEGLSP